MIGDDCCDADWLGRSVRDAIRSHPGGFDCSRCSSPSSRRSSKGSVATIDCRSSVDYNKVHVRNAVNLTLPTLIMRRFTKGQLPVSSLFNYCCGGSNSAVSYCANCSNNATNKSNGCTDEPGASVSTVELEWKRLKIVLYDDNSRSVDVNSSTSSTSMVGYLLKSMKDDGFDVCFLEGGFQEFYSKHPDLCIATSEEHDEIGATAKGLTNLRLNPSLTDEIEEKKPFSPEATTFPVEVIPNLFLGDAKNATDLNCLESNNITYILNVTRNVPCKFETSRNFRYLQIPINDHWSQSLTAYFQEAITFIDEGRGSDRGVLVHCLAGISRSVTVTVAYLMYERHLSLNDAYDFVKRCKPNVSPNFNFMGQLLDFEETLKSGKFTKSTAPPPKQSSPSPDDGSGDLVVDKSEPSEDLFSNGSTNASSVSRMFFSPAPSSLSSMSSASAVTSSSCTSTSLTFDYENV